VNAKKLGLRPMARRIERLRMILFAASDSELEKVLATQTVTERNPTTGQVKELRSKQPDFGAIDSLPNWQIDDPEDLVARAMGVDPAAAAREITPVSGDESRSMTKLSSAACAAIRKAGPETLAGLDVAAALTNGRGLFAIED
jgi:hypothetical protein